MAYLRSTLFNIIFYLGSLIYGTIMMPCLISKQTARLGIDIWAKFILLCMRLLLGLNYDLKGLDNLPKSGAIIASKHQSAWETVALWVIVPNVVFILKRELYYIPIVGWWLWRAGNIGINRAGGSETMKQLIRDCKASLAEGANLVIFPEGTRTAPDADPNYKKGVAALAKATKAPVIPTALNSGVYWRRNAYTKQPGTIKVSFLPAITYDRTFLENLKSLVETECKQFSEPDKLTENADRILQ